MMDLHFSRFPGFKSPQLGFVPVVQTRIVLASSRHWAILPVGILSPLAHRTCCWCLCGAWVCLSKETESSLGSPRAYQNWAAQWGNREAQSCQPPLWGPTNGPAPMGSRTYRSIRTLFGHVPPWATTVQAFGRIQAKKNHAQTVLRIGYPLVMTNIAMENDPFIDGLPIKHGDFPWLC